MKAGKYIATQKGFLMGRIIQEGDTVTLSKEYIDAQTKAGGGKEFTASWLEPREESEIESKPAIDTEREEVKTALKDAGIDFHGATSTEKLKAMLEEHLSNPEAE